MLFSSRRKFNLTLPDKLIVVFVIYLFLNRYFVSHTEGYTLKYLQSCALVIVYFLLRSYPAKYHKYFLYSIIFSGLLQSIYGMLQLYGIFPSRHSLFNITGSFFNPGPYAGYLSIVLPLALALWLKEREQAPDTNAGHALPARILLKAKSLVPFAAFIAVLLVLPATRSRAAWLAALISSAIVLNYFYPVRTLPSPFRKPGLKKFLALSIVLILVAGALTGVYFMKKGSADGRLFIWKTSCQLIKEKPVFGHGAGKFTAYYMGKQEDYFKESIESYEEAYPTLKNNGGFLIMYGKALSLAGKYGKAIEVLQEAGNYQKNTILYNALGDSYKATGEFKKAESAYMKAYYMLPGRFYSKYLLAILYRETGQQEKALATARELMEKEVKVSSMAIEEIRTEMKKTILGQEDDQ